MIICIDEAARVEVTDLDNFRQFHCEISGSKSIIESINRFSAGAVEVTDENTAWVNAKWLADLGSTRRGGKWLEDYLKMTEQAKSYGWVSSDGRKIKAHIVWSSR